MNDNERRIVSPDDYKSDPPKRRESLDDQVRRLRAMIERGQQTWDLSLNDVEAISLAVRVLSVIETVNPLSGISVYKTMIGAGIEFDGKHFQGASLLECFSAAGRSME